MSNLSEFYRRKSYTTQVSTKVPNNTLHVPVDTDVGNHCDYSYSDTLGSLEYSKLAKY